MPGRQPGSGASSWLSSFGVAGCAFRRERLEPHERFRPGTLLPVTRSTGDVLVRSRKPEDALRLMVERDGAPCCRRVAWFARRLALLCELPLVDVFVTGRAFRRNLLVLQSRA